MFSSEPEIEFKFSDWDFTNSLGPFRLVFDSSELPDNSQGAFRRIDNVVFTECDFGGVFKAKLLFKNCSFIRCDFGLSTFSRAKFTNCIFTKSSFSQCRLDNCEFRNCQYYNISYSGNETELNDTLITEPHGFVFGGSASLDNLPPHIDKTIQKLKFEESRSTISRAILYNLRSEGSEDAYYQAVRTSSICEDNARMAEGRIRLNRAWNNAYNQSCFKRILAIIFSLLFILSAWISKSILLLMGTANGWGGNVARVIAIGTLFILLIASGKWYFGNTTWLLSLKNTVEVFFLFGYTNHSSPQSASGLCALATALSGLMWYAIAIPTIVNRLTKHRG